MSEENSNPTQTSIALMIFIVLMAILIPWLVDKYLIQYYISGWYWMCYAKLTAIYHLTSVKLIANNLGEIFFWVDYFIIDSSLPKNYLLKMTNDAYLFLISIESVSPSDLKAEFIGSRGEFSESFHGISRLVMAIYMPIYLFLSATLSYKMLTRNHYNEVYNLDSFAESMAEGFPELLPVVYENPLNQDLDKGDWRMSPKIFSYLKLNGCIKEFIDDGREVFKLDDDRLTDLLVEQLGKKWVGFEKLDVNYKTVAAIALPMVVSPSKGKEETYKLITALGFAYSSKPAFVVSLKRAFLTVLNSLFSIKFYIPSSNCKKMWKKLFADLNGVIIGINETNRQRKNKKLARKLVESYIKKYRDHELVKGITKKHAYNMTVLAALIEKARLGGVLPSCSCLWLKREDRALFYAFNNLGRHVSWIEVVGFWSHYVSEKTVGVPYPYPKIESGVEGVDDALHSSFYNYRPLFER